MEYANGLVIALLALAWNKLIVWQLRRFLVILNEWN
jgi:hypothetical protein